MTMRERIAEGKLFTDYCEGSAVRQAQSKKADEKAERQRSRKYAGENIDHQKHFR